MGCIRRDGDYFTGAYAYYFFVLFEIEHPLQGHGDLFAFMGVTLEAIIGIHLKISQHNSIEGNRPLPGTRDIVLQTKTGFGKI